MILPRDLERAIQQTQNEFDAFAVLFDFLDRNSGEWYQAWVHSRPLYSRHRAHYEKNSMTYAYGPSRLLNDLQKAESNDELLLMVLAIVVDIDFQYGAEPRYGKIRRFREEAFCRRLNDFPANSLVFPAPEQLISSALKSRHPVQTLHRYEHSIYKFIDNLIVVSAEYPDVKVTCLTPNQPLINLFGRYIIDPNPELRIACYSLINDFSCFNVSHELRGSVQKFHFKSINMPDSLDFDDIVQSILQQGINIAVFPELTVDASALQKLKDALGRHPQVRESLLFIVAGSFHRSVDGRRKNIARIIDHEGTLVWAQAKMHFYEDDEVGIEDIEIAPRELVIFDTPVGRIAVLICFDFIAETGALTSLLEDYQINIMLVPSMTGTGLEDDRAFHARSYQAGRLHAPSIFLSNTCALVRRRSKSEKPTVNFYYLPIADSTLAMQKSYCDTETACSEQWCGFMFSTARAESPYIMHKNSRCLELANRSL